MRRIAIVPTALVGLALLAITAPPVHAQNTSDITYRGEDARYVQHVLSRVPGWKVPSCPNCSDGITPALRISRNSQRDAYVSAAVTFAWAAEAYSRMGKDREAEDAAGEVRKLLEQADALCSDGPAFSGGGTGEQTLHIWPCPPPF